MLDSIVFCLIFFLFLVFLGIPIAYAMVATGIFYQLVFGGGADELMIPFVEMKKGVKFTLLAVPLFILLGNIMNETTISIYIVNFARRVMPKIPGRTGLITILACAATGPLTGSANGTTTSIGTIMIPQMKRVGYNPKYSAALLAYSGILGSLIPPSISGLIYALITSQSVMAVWLATMGAGLVYFVILSSTNYFLSKKKGFEVTKVDIEEADHEKKNEFNIVRALPAALVPISILGGIYGGIVTATEAGALGSFVVLLLGLFYYKTIHSIKQLISVLYITSFQTASIMFLVCGSFALSNIMVSSLATKTIGFAILSITGNKYIVLLVTELLLIVLGCFMDDIPIMIILAPIASIALLPLGFHPLHIAGCFVLVCLIGLITPPVGQVLYAASAVSGESIDSFLKEIYMFFIPAFISILIVTFIPEITLFFPKLLIR